MQVDESLNDAIERPKQRAKPACEGPSRMAGYVSYCRDHLGNDVLVRVPVYHAPPGVHRPHKA
jgi:hypothetical protein